jgi:hypothetical protein
VIRIGFAALLATVVTGCFVTTDENLWRQRPEAGVDTGAVDGATIRDRATNDGPIKDVVAGDGPAQDIVIPDTTKKLANGSPCSAPGVCASGQCADGVCCASTCGGVCEACDLAGHLGVCWPVGTGQDPDSECAKQATSTCGRDGVCDGKGACRLYAGGTVCSGPTCVTATSSQKSQCDGKGSCVKGPLDACLPYICRTNTGKCRTSCNKDSHCVAYRCSFSSKCYSSCSNSWQCRTGYSCKNKVCIKN